MSQTSGSMVPISGRIEDELYQWFVSLEYPGAKTNSDKLREALKDLKRQHEATDDLVKAKAWSQNMTANLREALSLIERDQNIHSEVFATLIDNVAAMVAVLISSRPSGVQEAAQIEDHLVRRAQGLTEALLRQALTPSAAAFDPEVIRRHSARVVELALLIDSPK